MIHEDTDQLVAHCLVNECCRNSRVNPTAQTADHAIATNLGANLFDLLGNHVSRVPSWRNAGSVVQEVLENVLTERRVLDLGVPLHAVDLLFAIRESCNRSCVGRCENFETVGGLHNLIAVRHPADLLGWLAVENFATGGYAKFGCTIFFFAGCVNATTENTCKNLKTVANSEHRNSEFENFLVELR